MNVILGLLRGKNENRVDGEIPMSNSEKSKTMEVRLNKWISDCGVCSRREADRLIEAGRVTVDGQIGLSGQKIGRGQTVCLDGTPISKEKETIFLAVNKPVGVVCTTEKKWGDPTLDELVDYPKRVFSVGRLDKDSEGLILMTNQGDLLNKIMKAGNYHEKEYIVTVDKKITDHFLKQMAKGVFLRDLNVTTRPCRAEKAGEYKFRIVLTQGLNRQIRRMCEALGYRVVRLMRVRIMNISLGRLPAGKYRHLTRQEVSDLMKALKKSENNTEFRYLKRDPQKRGATMEKRGGAYGGKQRKN